jgi:hypothetical protein
MSVEGDVLKEIEDAFVAEGGGQADGDHIDM